MSAAARARRRSCRSVVVGMTLAVTATACGAAQATSDGVADAILARIQSEPLTPTAPRLEWRVGDAPGRKSGLTAGLLSLPVWVHQSLVSVQDGDRCVFAPSCSVYAAQALRSRGLAGWPMASDRILRCHHGAHGTYPSESGYALDPVPRPGGTPLSLVGGLASVIPGLGQWIAGDRADALYALGTVGLLAWGALRYARHEQTAPAAALGGLGVFFYVGAVYGGARAVGEASRP